MQSIKKHILWKEIYTKRLRIIDEIIVHYLGIGSNKNIGTELAVETLYHLKELWVVQGSSSL